MIISNLTVCVLGDSIENKAVTSLISEQNGPCYLRLGKAGEPIVHQNELEIGIGKMLAVIEGKGTAILSTGAMLKYSYDYLMDNKLNWGLYSFPFIKPLDSDGLKMIADNYEKIIIIEVHQKSGGFGSTILEGYNELETKFKFERPKIRRIAINDLFIDVAGSQKMLRELACLNL